MRVNGTLYWLLTDHLGSTNVTLDANGNRVTELRYYPYGNVRYNPGSQVTTYRFTGQRWDSGTGLYWYQSRWYDPIVGRFVQPDTIVPEPGNPQDLNRYAYSRNNPLRYRDPSGHWPWLWALWETFFGHGVSGAGGDEYDPVTGQSCGDTGCVTPRQTQMQMALGVAQDVVVAETGARVAGKVVTEVAGRIAGRAAEQGTTALRELATETTELAGKEVAEQTGETFIKAIRAPTQRSGLRRAMEKAGIEKPAEMTNAQVHHNLPWKFRDWFAAERRGLNVNDPQFGRWVEGTPPGSHQNWTAEYERAWRVWIRDNQDATRQQVLDFLNDLLSSGRFPSQ